MIKIEKLIVQKEFYWMPVVVRDLLIEVPTAVLAGGAIRDHIVGVTPVDYDIFFYDHGKKYYTAVDDARRFLWARGFDCVFECPNGQLYTYKNKDNVKVQLILKRKYEGLHDLFESFDFNLCCYATKDDCSAIYYTREAHNDLYTKKLTLNNIEYPVATINRLYKYRQKGYNTSYVIQQIVETLDVQGTFAGKLELYVD